MQQSRFVTFEACRFTIIFVKKKTTFFLKDIKDCNVLIFFVAVFGVVPSTAVADAIGLRVMIYYCVKSCFALKLEELKKRKRKTLRSEF